MCPTLLSRKHIEKWQERSKRVLHICVCICTFIPIIWSLCCFDSCLWVCQHVLYIDFQHVSMQLCKFLCVLCLLRFTDVPSYASAQLLLSQVRYRYVCKLYQGHPTMRNAQKWETPKNEEHPYLPSSKVGIKYIRVARFQQWGYR